MPGGLCTINKIGPRLKVGPFWGVVFHENTSCKSKFWELFWAPNFTAQLRLYNIIAFKDQEGTEWFKIKGKALSLQEKSKLLDV